VTRTFYGFLLIGILVALAASALLPLPENQRFRSTIAVVPDGGREEVFVIQWPDDRIDPLPVPAAVSAGVGVAVNSAGSIEVFRVRDVGGNVIGLASRSTSARPSAGLAAGRLFQGSDWTLHLPARGSLFLSQWNSRDVAPVAGPDGVPQTVAERAEFWGEAQSLRVTAGPADNGAGRVTGGAGEFAGLAGNYEERWDRESATASGPVRGRITLTTQVEASEP
jgi:hypothetical protein